MTKEKKLSCAQGEFPPEQNTKPSVLTRIRIAIKNNYTGWLFIMPTVLGVLLFTMYPMISSFIYSFFDYNIVSPPQNFGLQNYIRPFTTGWKEFSRSLQVTVVFVEACQVIGVPFTAALCAFGFSRVKFRFRETLFAILLSTMMLPGICTQIPLYVTYVKIGWLNTLLPFTVTAFFGGGAMNIFLIRQFMRGVPKEMDEAAKIDGANAFMIFLRLVLPLCMPVIVLIMVQTFIGNWNDFMGPLLYLRDERVYTLAIGVYSRFSGSSDANSYANVQMAVGLYMMLPCAVIFFIFQKQLIDGVQLGAIKG